jgi:ribosomal protein S18 acetylase RimI-like enzyme
MKIAAAIPEDIPSLVALINNAYRGDASRKGWTTEADLLNGELRTDENVLLELMMKPGAYFLKCINEATDILGCVYLEKNETRLYLGMLSVSPVQQAKGIGKKLMKAAEHYAGQLDCKAIFMRVISVRVELINWYEKQGYRKTGETEPFPEDHRFGIPTQLLEFLMMEKQIAAG